MAPGLTVKSRLSVLEPSQEKNYYEALEIVPSGKDGKPSSGTHQNRKLTYACLLNIDPGILRNISSTELYHQI